MPLPLIAGLLPALTFESATVGLSLGAFFTALWQKNIRSDDGYDFSFSEDLEQLPTEYRNFDNSIIEQTNANSDNFVTALETYASALPDKQVVVPTNTSQNISTQTSLLSLQKASSIELVEQKKIANNALAVKNEISLKLLEAKGVEISNQNKLIAILSENLQALNISLATLGTIPKILSDHSEYSVLIQSQILGAIQDLTEATKNQKLSSTFQAGETNINIDTAPLAEANKTIASGVTDQITTNAKIVENLLKQNDHYDYLKDGASTLKDTNGVAIIPREVQAKINAEKLIEQESTNKTTIEELMEYVPDIVGETIDGVAGALGTTDGFSLDFNPFDYVDNILKTDLDEYITKLKNS